MNTLKYLIYTIVFLTATAVGSAQDYNNIEFVENKGQWDERIRYKGEVNAGAVFVRSTGFTILQHNREDFAAIESFTHHPSSEAIASMKRGANGSYILRSHAYNVDFVGASSGMQVLADKPISTYNNYFIGNDPSRWASECRIFQGITLKEVYPNVDVRYYTYNGVLKYDIIARPGADIRKIALKYEGVDKLQVKNKELVLSTSVGELRESFPYTYQSDGKQRKEVTCKYVIKDNIVRFDVKDYDRNATLIIDPSLIFCSLSGSTADNWGFTATYGPDGSFYGGGIAMASGFPVSPGAFQTLFAGGVNDGGQPHDIAIIRLTPNGGNRIYATYIGGNGNEQPHSLIADPQGNLIIAGRTGSTNYPIVGAPSPSANDLDIVVTKLNSAGTALIGSKKIGGLGLDGVNIKIGRSGPQSLEQNYGDDGRSEVILDGAGNIYVASCTQSANFPVTPGAFQQVRVGGATATDQDGVLLKFSPDLSTLIFASYMGGSATDAAYVLALGPGGDIYVAGGTQSDDFLPGTQGGTVGPSLHGAAGDMDGFVARINNNGSAIIRSTYIGTTAPDQIYGIQFDRNGFPYVMGQTRGSWPVVNAAYSSLGGKQFIAKLQPDLSAFVYSTMFGTGSLTPNISPTAFLVDRCENVYVSGWGGTIATNSGSYPSAGTTGLPVTPDALKPTTDGSDFYFFVLRKDAAGPGPLYASFFGQNGGTFNDHVDGGTSRFDQNGVIYQSVCANCGGGTSFPTSPGAWATVKPNTALCNLGMVKIAFNLSGVSADVQSAIGGVPSDTSGCFPLEVVFTDNIRNATEYIWNFGEGDPDVGPLPAATGYTQTNTFDVPGLYRVMLVAINPASCNVRDTSYINIRVGDLRADLAADYVKIGPCTSLTYQFNNLTPVTPRPFTNTTFIWDFGDGSPRVTTGPGPVTHSFPAFGPYIVRLILNDTAYCNHPDSIDIPLNIAANVDAKFSTDPGGCSPYTASFTNESDGGVTYLWDFGDPTSPDNTSTDENPTHVYSNPGTYTVTFTVTDPNTCNVSDVATFPITVQDGPVAAFSFTPPTAVVNTPNIFTNLSTTNAIRFKWVWDNGDSLETTSRADITYQFNATGNYNVCLTAYNQFGCPNTTCQRVPVIIEPALGVPNAFTPGRSDVNSIVKVEGFGIGKMKFIIYNRWGQKVFETSNRLQGWDGKVNGAIQPMDVYAYTLEVEFTDGTKASKKGDITLIR